MPVPDEPTRVFRESDFPSHPADDRTQMFPRVPEDRYPRARQPRPAAQPVQPNRPLPYKDQAPALPARAANPPVARPLGRAPRPAFVAAAQWHWVLTLTWRPPKGRERKQSTFSGVFRPRPMETRSEAFEGIVRDCLKTSGWDGNYTVLFWAMEPDSLD